MTSVTLADLVADMSLTPADVSCISGLDESTVSRMWRTHDWLDRIKGRTLQKLIGSVPGVAEYLANSTVEKRRSSLFASLAREGLVVDRGVFGELVGDRCIPAQWLCNALETALLVMRGDERATAAHMARFWGHKQFRILRLVTQSDCSAPLIADVDPLATAGPIMLDRIMARENSFHAILTEAILSYFYAQRTGRLPPALQEPIVDRRGALSYRNATLGLIPVTGNLDEVDRFCHAIEHSSVMSAVETWAFSTVHYDSSITTDFSLPRSLLLRGAAGNVVQELEKCNDAYFYYLVRAAIPLLLQRDPTLGLRGSHVRSAIANRMERCAERGITREANILLSHWPAAA